MRIILDTNVLFHRRACQLLANKPDDLVLPAVAFAERVRQVQRRGGTVEELWRTLAKAGIEVESFGVEEALLRPWKHLDDRSWLRLARDAMIAGHVGPGDMLWTSDVDDFVAVGVARGQIQDTATL